MNTSLFNLEPSWCDSQRVFGKFTGTVRTAHDVQVCEVEKDQAMFQDTVDRVDSVVGRLG